MLKFCIVSNAFRNLYKILSQKQLSVCPSFFSVFYTLEVNLEPLAFHCIYLTGSPSYKVGDLITSTLLLSLVSFKVTFCLVSFDTCISLLIHLKSSVFSLSAIWTVESKFLLLYNVLYILTSAAPPWRNCSHCCLLNFLSSFAFDVISPFQMPGPTQLNYQFLEARNWMLGLCLLYYCTLTFRHSDIWFEWRKVICL